MGKRIAIVGVGAVGGYTGAHMARAGEDVTFLDMWPAHVDAMKTHGLHITHYEGEAPFTVEVRALHLTEAQHLAKEAPIDIAFICTKSYDTEWAAMLIRQYLAPSGYVVSLQNCMNEAAIAEIVGWGKTLGCIASNISVGLVAPGHVHRGGVKGGAAHTVFRTGEVHGAATERAHEIRRLVSYADSAKVTDNLWGERWSKLVANSMANGVSASTGLAGAQLAQNPAIRHFQARLGSEAIRIGQARGYKLEEIDHLPPETIARAGEGDAEALAVYDERRLSRVGRGSPDQRPSMGQDMMKGRRTEIEYLNGFVVREGEAVGIAARANERLVDIVKRVERGELEPDPRHITELRVN
jgi:2-dehydropantoate 2-reductase